jgi:uncharacterized membrane protein YidH (DUF202 family)
MNTAVGIVGFLSAIAGLMLALVRGTKSNASTRHRIGAVTVGLVLAVVGFGAALWSLAEQQQDRISDAQECVDSGGSPFRADSRGGGVTCIYPEDR